MGFPHCPICAVLAFVSACIGFTSTYMFFILFKEFIGEEPKLKLNFNIFWELTAKYKYFINRL